MNDKPLTRAGVLAMIDCADGDLDAKLFNWMLETYPGFSGYAEDRISEGYPLAFSMIYHWLNTLPEGPAPDAPKAKGDW